MKSFCKNKIILLTVLFSFIFQVKTALSESQVNLYFFYAEGCPHCAKEKIFLEKIKEQQPNVNIRAYEVSKSPKNSKILSETGKKLGFVVSGVPVTVIGDNYIIGWQSAETTGQRIENLLKEAQSGGCRDVVGEVLKKCEGEKVNVPFDKVHLPIVGDINLKNYSLPALAVILGSLDGFNPCAMWVLVFLIGLLINMENKARRWILGFTFIIASAAVYFVFMSAWLNLLIFLGFIFWIRIAIGLVAVGAGLYNLKEYREQKNPTCKVTKPQQRKMIFEKLRNYAGHRSFPLAIFGIIALAFSVNLIELVCSAGLPALFTQILTLSALSTWKYYFYILIYIFFFMLDDLIVFIVAMITLQATGLTTRYTRLSHLIGGIIMIILGILLIFRHEWLSFQ